jgi:tetratricopeptide (TPR) repeat protein
MLVPAAPRVSLPRVIVPVTVTPYPPAVERNYLFRVRQLESDLAGDPGEYLLCARLGLLHLRLAAHTPDRERRERRYDKARRYFERAADRAHTRREQEWAVAQQDTCSDTPPVADALDSYFRPDLAAAATPSSLAVEDQLRLRAQFLEMRVLDQPESPRLLCRLGLTYVRLGQVMAARNKAALGAWPLAPGESGRRQTRETASRLVLPSTKHQAPSAAFPQISLVDCRRRAAEALKAALGCARSREMRVECYLGLAELYRTEGNPLAGLGMLRRVLVLQPNHWLAQLRAASLLARLGNPDAARRHRALAERWHTPEWL